MKFFVVRNITARINDVRKQNLKVRERFKQEACIQRKICFLGMLRMLNENSVMSLVSRMSACMVA